jgi:hypothetical protein
VREDVYDQLEKTIFGSVEPATSSPRQATEQEKAAMATCTGFERECNGKAVSLGLCGACYARKNYRAKHPKSGADAPKKPRKVRAEAIPVEIGEAIADDTTTNSIASSTPVQDETQFYFWLTANQMQKLLQKLLVAL